MVGVERDKVRSQKTMELYHVPPAFTPMFTYERSVPYPHGHRNVMFVRRGVRPLPRLVNPQHLLNRRMPHPALLGGAMDSFSASAIAVLIEN